MRCSPRPAFSGVTWKIPMRFCRRERVPRVFENAHRERRVRNLALQLAQRTPVGANPLLDYLIVSSDSVGQGLERLTRYLRLVNPSVGLTVRRERSARTSGGRARTDAVLHRADALPVRDSVHA